MINSTPLRFGAFWIIGGCFEEKSHSHPPRIGFSIQDWSSEQGEPSKTRFRARTDIPEMTHSR
jgi:hypothetical protein